MGKQGTMLSEWEIQSSAWEKVFEKYGDDCTWTSKQICEKCGWENISKTTATASCHFSKCMKCGSELKDMLNPKNMEMLAYNLSVRADLWEKNNGK